MMQEEIKEHFVVLKHPGNIFLGHFSPESGKAMYVAREIIGIIQDGFNVNTGKHGGVIKRIKLELDCPLRWLVCLLHLIELLLREMFRK